MEDHVLTNPTINKLVALSLSGMAAAFKEQLERSDYATLAFEDRLGLLVDREATERENRRLARTLKAANLRIGSACIEDLDLRSPRGLDRSVVLALADAGWVASHQNVLIVGPTGVGKTYLACAFAQAALRKGYTALYLRAPRLFTESRAATAGCRRCSLRGPASTSSSSTTWRSSHSICPRDRTCSRSSRTARSGARPSSPANCQSASGTTPSAMRPSRTPSSTVCYPEFGIRAVIPISRLSRSLSRTRVERNSTFGIIRDRPGISSARPTLGSALA